jgi:hypothetical protein
VAPLKGAMTLTDLLAFLALVAAIVAAYFAYPRGVTVSVGLASASRFKQRTRK